MSVIERQVTEAPRLHVADVLRREPGLSGAVHLRSAVEGERHGYAVASRRGVELSKLANLFVGHKRQRELYAMPLMSVNAYFESNYAMTLTRRDARDYRLDAVSASTYASELVSIDENVLGENIRRLREDAGHLNAAAFARSIGITPQTLKGWETGRYKDLRLESLLTIAKGIPCKVDALLDGLYDTTVKVEVARPIVTFPDKTSGITEPHSIAQSGEPRAESAVVVRRPSRSPLIIATELEQHVTKLRAHADSISELAKSLVRRAPGIKTRKDTHRTPGGPGGTTAIHRGTARHRGGK
jgi:DNA-binding transcriptional regulator YiaG